jgi:hypothetical protein
MSPLPAPPSVSADEAQLLYDVLIAEMGAPATADEFNLFVWQLSEGGRANAYFISHMQGTWYEMRELKVDGHGLAQVKIPTETLEAELEKIVRANNRFAHLHFNQSSRGSSTRTRLSPLAG